jgi:hypothetical protein
MVDKINESVDIVVQLFDNDDDDGEYDNDDDLYNETNNTTCFFNKQNDNHHQMKNEKEISIDRILAYRLNARPLYCIKKNEMKLIQEEFKKQNRLLLKTYGSNAMYSCTKNEFEEHISIFITQTNAYNLIEELNDTNSDCIQKYLDDLVNQITTVLNDLLQFQFINSMQYQEMKVIRSKVRFDYLFFLPDTRKVSIVSCFLHPYFFNHFSYIIAG